MASRDPLARKTVLVVEDDADLRHIFRDAIRSAGFEVREAADGLAALRMVEFDAPDLIVLDVRLPALDGISVREEVASHADTRDIPVIIVSAFDVDRHRVRRARIMRKPITPVELIDAVRGALNGHA